MKRYLIKKITNLKYELKDDKNKIYYIYLEFFQVDKPKINDYIIMDDYYLDKNSEEKGICFTFGVLKGKFCKKLTVHDKKEIIVIKNKDEEIYLQRYYG